jgi:predicted transcriptional regulator of viral defense system
MIEVRQLRYAVLAADQHSFARAARTLNVKQSTLSRTIADLEHRLRIQLFDRTSRGAIPTDTGKNFLSIARRIITDIDNLQTTARAVSFDGCEFRNQLSSVSPSRMLGTAGEMVFIYSIYVLCMTIMTKLTSLRHKTISLLQGRAAVRWRDLAAAGVTPATIGRLVKNGEVDRISRGLYRLASQESGAHQSLAELAQRAPKGIICLASALHWHGLTTQLPQAVWLMIAHKDRPPANLPVRLHVVRASGEALTAGIMSVQIDGVTVRLTNPAKTVADCFKYRSSVGLDVAIEALRDGLSARAFTPDAFMAMAAIDRVARVARPYLEAIV